MRQGFGRIVGKTNALMMLRLDLAKIALPACNCFSEGADSVTNAQNFRSNIFLKIFRANIFDE